MKSILLMLILLLGLTGCGAAEAPAQVAATTLPVYEFTSRLCQETGITVTRLVTEEVSCLHDYSLNVRQVKAAEAAELIVMNGAGLETFLEDILLEKEVLDASRGIQLLCPAEADHGHGHEDHHHESDPHIWLDPDCAMTMSRNICQGLVENYPEHRQQLEENLKKVLSELQSLKGYGEQTLAELSCRELITFHDGFSYFAAGFDLTILRAVEEESGREASAGELICMIREVESHGLPAIFTEKSGSVSAAGIISRETGCQVYALDMAMAGESYFDAMYHNIDTIKEAFH